MNEQFVSLTVSTFRLLRMVNVREDVVFRIYYIFTANVNVFVDAGRLNRETPVYTLTLFYHFLPRS